MQRKCLLTFLSSSMLAAIGLAGGQAQQISTGEVSTNQPASTPLPPTSQNPGLPTPAPATNNDIDFDNIAKIPYEALIKIAQSDASQPKDAEIYSLRISSKIATIHPSQIELFLDREAAPQVLKVDPNGYFLVPHNEELLKENPDLVSNQPKGSLNLEVKLSLPKPELPKITDGRVMYRDLFKPILELNEAMRKVDPDFGLAEHQQFAVEVATGAEGWVRIQRKFGARTLSPDENGSVWLIFETIRFEENPEIQILPLDAELSVRPISPDQAKQIRAR